MSESPLSRRTLMQTALAAGAGLAVPGSTLAQATTKSTTTTTAAAAPPAPRKASPDKPGMAVIGAGGIARWHGQFLPKHVNVVAVADVDRGRAEAYAKDFGVIGALATQDYRAALERKGVDVVLITTPDHWHAKQLIDSVRAGKDVYCEKPLTLTIDEGRVVCQAVRESGRIVQVGSQQRSQSRFHIPVGLVHAGRLGKVKRAVVVLGPTPYPKDATFETKPPPPELDWDGWLGPAPQVDYMKERCHFHWRWWYEYAGGMTADWGAHHVDIAQWAIAPDLAGPTLIEPVSVKYPVPFDDKGYPTAQDRFNTPSEFTVKLSFANGVEMIVTDKSPDVPEENGILIEGESGDLFVSRGKLRGKAVDAWTDDPLPPGTVPNFPRHKIPHERHMANFLDCCRDRSTPLSDVWTHHRNLTSCHLANIAIRLNRRIRWDATAQQIVGDSEANALQIRAPRKGFELI